MLRKGAGQDCYFAAAQTRNTIDTLQSVLVDVPKHLKLKAGGSGHADVDKNSSLKLADTATTEEG